MTPGPQDSGCLLLPWDSEFFGFRIAKVGASTLDDESLCRALRWSDQEKVTCLYLSADPESGQTLALALAGGFQFVDVRLDLSARLDGERSPAPDAATVRVATADDLPALQRLARRAHTDTRFFKDRGFPRERCGDLYAEWIRRDLQDHHVFVVSGAPQSIDGYVTCYVEGAGAGRIGLTAVDERSRGRGYGAALLQSALQWLRQRGCGEARVATQASNVASQRLYQAAGFRTRLATVWFHRWFERGDAG